MTENFIQTENKPITPQRDYVSEILATIKSNLAPRAMREKILDYHENDIAAALELITKDERRRLFSIIDAETLSSVLTYSQIKTELINELTVKRKIDVLSFLEPLDAAEYLETLPENERATILELMNEEARDEIKLVASFDEDEIGRRMATNYISITYGASVKEAMNALIDQSAENDNISTLYVIDEDDMFVGAIDLKDLIRARSNTDLGDITMTSYPYVYAFERVDDCIERIKSYSEDSIPVLDSSNKLVGVLISQDITQLVDEELGEDYAMLAGLSAEEDLYEPIKKSVGKRLPWLIVLLGLGLIVSTVVGAFEHVVAHLSLIVCFQSLILGMAGNAGTQSLAVTIRVLTDENLSTKQRLYLVSKEARVGAFNGILLGILSFGFIGAYIMLIKGYPPAYSFSVSLCTGIALAISILISSVMGTVVPLIFKRMNIDPAVASGPLITTVNDLIAVISYYGLAWVLLINVLGL